MRKLIDLTGQKFDYLEVIGIYDKDKHGIIRWKCRCKCGNIIPVYKANLLKNNGTIKSCGCAYIEELSKEIGKKKDLLEIIGTKQHGRKGRLLVKCSCGNIKEMTLSQFNSNTVHSCGCMGVAKGDKSPNYKHGMTGTRLYKVYQDMFSRCYNFNDVSYPNYGAKGITICKEWLGDKGVSNFRDWSFANGYDKNAKRGECTLDRIDNNKGYSPDNCRWVSMLIQSNNKTNNILYEIDGVTKTLSEWCREYEISNVQSVWRRVKKGMDIKTALTQPMQKKVSEMTESELEERKVRQAEQIRKWREENKEHIIKKRKEWEKNNIDRIRKSKRKYEEKKKIERKSN